MTERAASPEVPVVAVMDERHPLRVVATLAAPTTGVMLVSATSTVLWTYFVSRLGPDAIAAVSLVFPLSLIVLTLMGGGIGAGISAAVARALGAGRDGEARRIAEQALVLTFVLGAVFTAILELVVPHVFAFLGGRGVVLEEAIRFARVLFAGLLVTFFAMALDSILRGEANTRFPALCGVLSLALQIVLTPLYMFVFGWGLVGAPLATITGQAAGVAVRLWFVFAGRARVRPRAWPPAVSAPHVVEILKVGVPASLATLANYASILALTGIVARFGNSYLAAYGLATRLDFMLVTLVHSVAVAALTLVGMALGAGRPDLVRRYTAAALGIVVVFVVVVAGVLLWKPEWWFGLFTVDADILAVGASYVRRVAPAWVFLVTAMVLGSALQAMQRAVLPLAVIVTRVALVLTAASVATGVLGAGAEVVFVIIGFGNLLSAALLVVAYRRAVRAAPERSLAAVAPACLDG